MKDPDLQVLPWSSLSLEQVEALFRLRQDVFVLEQACPYSDIDGMDPKAWHILCYVEGQLAACARLFPAGIFPPLHTFQVPDDGISARIGRIATYPAFRSRGLAGLMVQQGIELIRTRSLGEHVRIAAQEHLVQYYRRFGFEPIGSPYVEDDIPHRDMLLVRQARH